MNTLGGKITTRKCLLALHYESKEIRHFSKPKFAFNNMSLLYKWPGYL